MIKRRHFLVGVFLFFISQLARVKSSPSVSLDTQLVRKWITFEDLPDIKEIKLNGKEIEMIKKSLEKNKGKRKAAADELGISERTLYRKIKQFDL